MSVSVVVPTYGRPAGLRRCVAAVLAQTHAELELVISDDGGTPAAGEVLADVEDDRLRVVRHDNAGPAAARNRGAAAASHAALAFTDDDCAPRPDWLARLVAAWDGDERRMVGGHTVNALPGNPRSEASQVLIDGLYAVLNADPADARFVTSNNILLAREGFEAVGGFDETYPLAAGEDRAFCRAWRASARTIALEPAAVIDHHHGLTRRGFWRQHANYGRGGEHFARTAADSGGGADGKLGLAGCLRLVTRPLPGRPGVAAWLAVAQAATAWGRFRQRRAGG